MNHLPASTDAQTADNALNHEQFQAAIASANRHFALIRKKYPSLRAYLVISLLGDQTTIESSLEQMIWDFPSLIPDGNSKSRMLGFLREPLPEKPSEAQKKQWKARFQVLAEDLEFIGNAQVELRFQNLDYELIWKLQSDDLVDHDLTPQTKASIRIVLGTIERFAEC